MTTAGAVAAPLFTGCAITVGGSNDVTLAGTDHAEKLVAGAHYLHKNGNCNGTFDVAIPRTLMFSCSADDMIVKCGKDGLPPEGATAKSRTKARTFFNRNFGGVIVIAIDK